MYYTLTKNLRKQEKIYNQLQFNLDLNIDRTDRFRMKLFILNSISNSENYLSKFDSKWEGLLHTTFCLQVHHLFLDGTAPCSLSPLGSS